MNKIQRLHRLIEKSPAFKQGRNKYHEYVKAKYEEGLKDVIDIELNPENKKRIDGFYDYISGKKEKEKVELKQEKKEIKTEKKSVSKKTSTKKENK
jgi:septal ring factor EnvC (AmiA/AmiB activator)